jgi:N-acetylmuramoyl-L-alanine amidase
MGLTLLAALGGAALELCAKTPSELAKERWERSQELLADLNAVPEPELGLDQYKLVAEAFKSVHRANPASGYCDDALLGAANIYARMASRFGEDSYKQRAIDAYRYVMSQYPYSKRLAEAAEAIRRLEAGEPVFLAQPAAAAEEDVDDGPVRQDAAENSEAVEAQTPALEAPSATATTVRYGASSGSSQTVAVGQKVELAPSRTRDSVALIQDVRYWRHPEYLRIVVQLDDFVLFKYDALASPPRLYFDLFSAKLTGDLAKGVSIAVPEDPVVSAIRFGQNRESKARLVLDLSENIVFDVSWLSSPPRMVLEIRPMNGAPAPVKPEAEQIAKAEQRTGQRTFEDALADAKRLQEAVVRDRPTSTGFLPSAQAASLPPRVPARTETQPSDLAVGSAAPAPTLAKVSPPAEAVLRPRDPEPENLAAPKPADSPSAGSQGLIRALGLKIGRVVIDAGHGGHDTGMIGPSGLREKDVVLDIALELGRLVEEKLGAEVVYTRTDDTYVKPAARTGMANDAKADLFISVHANASSVRSVRGIETYYLNLTTDPWAMKVASRENADSDRSVHELRDLLGKIAQQDRIAESREFATRMQTAVFSGLTKGTSGLRNRGVRQAPLIVLIGAQMPAILAEVGFLSNPTDEKLFQDKTYRRQVAQHLYDGIADYMGTLSNNQLTRSGESRASAARGHD